jgi:hypothetical protein
MQYARVAARLMLRNGVLLFEHSHCLARKPLEKAISRRQPDNPAADDDEVAALHEQRITGRQDPLNASES